MNFRLTIALIVFLLAAAISFYFFSHPAANTAAAPKPDAVFAEEPKAVTALTFSRAGAVVVAFKKENENWMMTDPVKAATEHYSVESIADDLKGLHFRNKFAPEASGAKALETVGLADPKASVKFTDAGGKERTLLIGKHSPTRGVYVRVAGDTANTVYEVDANWYDSLDKDPAEFRSKQLYTLSPEKVSALGIGHPGEKDAPVELVKSAADGKWVIQRPIATRASAAVMDDVLNQARNVRVHTFETLPREDPAVGLATPRLTVKIFENTDPPSPPSPERAGTQPASAPASQPSLKVMTLDFGNFTDLGKKEVYAALGGSSEVVTISAESFKGLDKKLNDLRDPAVTPAPVAEATALEIRSAAPQLPLTPAQMSAERTATGWAFAAGGITMNGPLAADSLAVADFLSALATLRANKYVDAAGDLKSIGLDPPAHTITLTLPRQTQREVLLIGNPEKAEPLTPVMRQGETTVYLVQTPDVARILAPGFSPLVLRDKAIDHLVPANIRSIAISGKGAAEAVTLEHAGISWKVVHDGKPVAADDMKISGLLGELDPLTATKWLAPALAEGTRPAAYITVRITYTLPPPSPPSPPPAATAPAATTTAPATSPATVPATAPILPSLTDMLAAGPTVTRTIVLSKEKDNTWTASYSDTPLPAWQFQPTPGLIEQLTATKYAVPPATAPATATAPAP